MFIPIKVILVASGEREGTWHNHTPDYKLKFNPMHVAHLACLLATVQTINFSIIWDAMHMGLFCWQLRYLWTLNL